MREEAVGVVPVLERVEPRQLARRVPAQRALVAVPVVDVHLDILRAGAARGDEDAARAAADLGGGGAQGGVSEAEVEVAGGGLLVFFFGYENDGKGKGCMHLQPCDGVSVRVGGGVVRDGLDDPGRVHVYCEECLTEGGVLGVDGVHVAHCADERRDVDSVEVEAPDAVEVAFDAGESVDAEFGRGLNVFPWDHGDVLVKGAEVYQRLDERHALFQRANVDKVGEKIGLDVVSIGAHMRWLADDLRLRMPGCTRLLCRLRRRRVICQ